MVEERGKVEEQVGGVWLMESGEGLEATPLDFRPLKALRVYEVDSGRRAYWGVGIRATSMQGLPNPTLTGKPSSGS